MIISSAFRIFVFSNMKNSLLLISLMLLILSFLQIQTIIIKGIVTSAVTGERPLPGVTLQVKGTRLLKLLTVKGDTRLKFLSF
jgi:hypothetical protein